MVVKTFRGVLAHGGQDRIRLSTIKGKMGYKIVKFEVIDTVPGTANVECVTKIYKTQQTTVDGGVNFTDSDLLAVNYYTEASSVNVPGFAAVIFDNEIFNQDIYVTYTEGSTNIAGNYYIELEVIPLDDKGAEYTTIKDLRTRGF